MARSHEVVRQWQVLRSLAASRLGLTVEAIAAEQSVTARTIRRDLAALDRAGFPLFQESGDSRLRWKVDPRALAGLDAGFTLIELCALYFSRATLECLTGAPFHDDLSRAFARFEDALAPGMRLFLDRLPSVVGAKLSPGRKSALRSHRERVSQLLEASLQRRKVWMRYHSISSQRTRDYLLDPRRVVYAEGGLYLIAYVPEYREARTFAVERIHRLELRDERFVASDEASAVFSHSMGVTSGEPAAVEIEVEARLAPYIAEREWHASQTVRRLPDGALRVQMHVCIDWALRRWILGFGAGVRVIEPSTLANDILDELDAARARYIPRIDLELPRTAWDLTAQRDLPFVEFQRLTLGEGTA